MSLVAGLLLALPVEEGFNNSMTQILNWADGLSR